MIARALPLVLVLTLGACSMSGLLPDWSSPDIAGPEPAYRYIIANHLKEVLGDPAPAGALEISAVKRIEFLKGASWQACIKTQKFPFPPLYHAVFIQRDKIVDTRVSVVIDRCELESYTPFDWATDGRTLPPPR